MAPQIVWEVYPAAAMWGGINGALESAEPTGVSRHLRFCDSASDGLVHADVGTDDCLTS